jgi:Fe2+ transport system protein FeoA
MDQACAGSIECPLSRITAGTSVRIKRLSAAPEVNQRLREIGMCEEQQIRLVSRPANLICMVCNARLGISEELADSIHVEPIVLGLEASYGG